MHSWSRIQMLRNEQRKLKLPALRRTFSHNFQPDVDYLLNNWDAYKTGALLRKGNYSTVLSEVEKLIKGKNKSELLSDKLFRNLAAQLPNRVHPDTLSYTEDYKIIKEFGNKPTFSFEPKTANDVLVEKDLLRTRGLNSICGFRSYYMVGHLAKLERALVEFSMRRLRERGFTLMSVPDIIQDDIIERCGMSTKSERTQIYRINSNWGYGNGWCLSGTAEMSLAASLRGQKIPRNRLPLMLAAASRCYRAEISRLGVEKGIYRVHQFTKVEMFGLCLPEQSAEQLEKMRKYQEETFELLGLPCRVIDMAPNELGRPAHRKYDIESWMPGLQMYGEISSCSDCTDYQTRRLDIRDESGQYLHTFNGTACAVPRVIIAIVENNQNESGQVCIPASLQPFMAGIKVLGMKRGPRLHIQKEIPHNLQKAYL